jgi:hypothetical protein
MSDEIVCENVYCQWVGSVVKVKDLPDACKPNMKDGRCMLCQISPQIGMGMKAADLIRNIKG